MGDDGVVLTDEERERLAELAESIGDPWLARQFVGGHDAPPPRPQHRLPFAGPIVHRLESAVGTWWAGLLLVLAGAALVLTTFTSSTLVASLGLLIMGVGVWRLVVDRGLLIVRRLTGRQASAPAPSPPHTPPAAP